MLLNVFFIIAGIVLVLWGAERLTDGSVALAERMNVPQIVIGLTIVAMGTSMPEFCVSLVSALKGTPDLAVGNVVGSNIFNAMLIVGVAAMVAPMAILKSTVKKDIPFAILASTMLFVMCLDGDLSRLDAVLLIGVFGLFMFITLQGAKPDEAEVGEKKNYSVAKSLLLLLAGLAGLIVGSNIFVDGATKIAHTLGVSDAVIGLTIVAGGTSLPELATSVVSARKGQSGIAIGNVLGSNVFNILFILGITGVICPMHIQGISTVDLSMMMFSMFALWLFSFTKYTIARWEGVLLVAAFVAYISYLVVQAVSGVPA
ncbi:MAG TPA: calcium/sodium antiporter [Prevotella sp.]